MRTTALKSTIELSRALNRSLGYSTLKTTTSTLPNCCVTKSVPWGTLLLDPHMNHFLRELRGKEDTKTKHEYEMLDGRIFRKISYVSLNCFHSYCVSFHFILTAILFIFLHFVLFARPHFYFDSFYFSALALETWTLHGANVVKCFVPGLITVTGR